MASFLKRSVSLHACGVVALVGSLFAGGAVRADRLLTFEDAVTANFEGPHFALYSSLDGTGYGGFSWSNALAYQRHASAVNGYTVGVGSSQKGFFTGFAQAGTISRPGRWILHDFACTAAWNTGVSVRITGTRSGVVVYDQTHVLGAPVARTTLNLNFANIDSVTIVGSRYAASFVLDPGDGNDDDMVEILDYGNFILDRSTGDNRVNNADFAVLSMHFFRVGASCTPAIHARQPRDRISVKELRRTGQGELAAADLNRDGWLDLRDIQLFMQGGASPGVD